MARPVLIAIDGPAASGKGTIARRLAMHFGVPHLDTGLIYRAVGQRMRDEGLDLDDAREAEAVARRFEAAWLEDERLREREAGVAASRVASVPALRAVLRAFQQDFAGQPAGAVLDGRDIGTVIAPHAPAKLWIDAAVEARANRRFRELAGRGEQVSEAAILADLVARDSRDAPNMVIAGDAVQIDTTHLGIEDAFAAALAAVEARLHIGA